MADSLTMDKDVLQMSQGDLSRGLYQAMELAECSIERRNIQKECKTTLEIAESIFCDHFWGVYNAYILGVNTKEHLCMTWVRMKTKFMFLKNIEVTTKLQANLGNSLLLVQDTCTPPGYCKLQLVLNGNPITMFHNMNGPDLLSEISKYPEIFKGGFNIEEDLYGRLLVCHTLLEQYKLSFQREIHGPAIQVIGIQGKVFDRDMVFAFRCRNLPKEAVNWFTRKRRYDWPPKAVIEKCRNLGFLVVPVGHPNSKEKDKIWRISLSLQERLLVTLFNSVQLKCFVLIKNLKNETINNKLKRKILTSYHCKTCMLFKIETTPRDFWAPSNLINCLETCLQKLLEWVNGKQCPNYFTAEENMFDKLTKTDLKLLAAALQTLLAGNLPNVLLHLGTSDIGVELYSQLDLTKVLQIDDITSLISDWHQDHKHYVLHECMKPNSPQTKFRQMLRCQLDLITALLSVRTSILVHIFSKDVKTVIENLQHFIDRLHCESKVTEHSEEETKSALSLFLPFIQPTLFATKIAALEHIDTLKIEVLGILRGQTWHVSNVPIDSLILKKSCILYALRYHDESINSLKSISEGVRFSFCSCDRRQIIKGDIGNPKEILLLRPEITDEITTKELLWKVVSPCVPFLPTEAHITPRVIMYECLRCLSLPAKPSLLHPSYEHRHEIAYVDGQFLNYFLLYLNHTKMQQRDLTWNDILLMHAVVKTRKIGHKAACLNILGWVLKREGMKFNAIQRFIQSIREEPRRNAAYWHLCFLMSESI